MAMTIEESSIQVRPKYLHIFISPSKFGLVLSSTVAAADDEDAAATTTCFCLCASSTRTLEISSFGFSLPPPPPPFSRIATSTSPVSSWGSTVWVIFLEIMYTTRDVMKTTTSGASHSTMAKALQFGKKREIGLLNLRESGKYLLQILKAYKSNVP